MKKSLTALLPHLIALIIFLLTSVIYFFPQLQGKVAQQGDYIQYQGAAKEIVDFREETGKATLWTNSMFGGMPTYQISSPVTNNIGRFLDDFLMLGFKKEIGYFISGMIGFYILLLLLGVNHWLAVIGAIAFAFGTNNIILYDTGHVTKVKTVFASAPIIAGTILAYRGKYLLGGLVFTVFMVLNLLANHPQMTYYLGMCMIIYVLIRLYQDWKGDNLKGFFKASGYLLFGLLIAIGTSASKLMTTYEYSHDTMRGKPILQTDNPNSFSSSETDGLAWEYAMSWSNGAIDLISSFIPGFTGGSSSEDVSGSSAVATQLSRRGVNVRSGLEAPLYWGGLPSTSGPIYFGAIVFFLFILGAFVVKGNVKWWLLGSVLLLMLLSMGKNFEVFNRLFFDFFPLYNKFRTPNSILSIAAILIPILSFWGLNTILENKDSAQNLKYLTYTAFGMGGLCLLLAVLGPVLFDISNPNDAQYGQMGFGVDALLEDRKSLLRSDSFRSFALIGLAALGIWLYMKSKINKAFLFGILAVLIVFDLWGVNKRYMNNESYVNARTADQQFTPRPVDNQILADTDPHYRVMDLSINTFNSSAASYFHKAIGGYHAAKLQRFQDLVDRHISNNNQKVLNMLNTKYYIVPGDQGRPTVQLNSAALGNAWFVNNIQIVEDHNAEIDALNTFDPAGDAIIHREFASQVEGFNPTKNGAITLTDYAPNKITYRSNTNSEQLAVFSEIWYGPDKGWRAYVDDAEVPIMRANYALRAIRVPAGQHDVRLEFDPSTFKIGETISLICSLLILLGLGFWFYKNILPKLREDLKEEADKPKAVPKAAKTGKKPVRKKKSRPKGKK